MYSFQNACSAPVDIVKEKKMLKMLRRKNINLTVKQTNDKSKKIQQIEKKEKRDISERFCYFY